MVLRDISDTAFWAAAYRASESERGDALFCDVFARRLAGERGQRIAEELKTASDNKWVIAIRTYLIDQAVHRALASGADMLINLGAGLDTRAYRMDLPRDLRWVEIDFPEILAYKDAMLCEEQPKCAIERIGMDLCDTAHRTRLFEDLGQRARRAIIVTEGLLIYMTKQEVAELSESLVLPGSFRDWIFDVQLPPLVRLLQQRMGQAFSDARIPGGFRSNEWKDLFSRDGWVSVEVSSILKTAIRNGRVPAEWGRQSRSAPAERGHDERRLTLADIGGRRIDGFVCHVSKQ